MEQAIPHLVVSYEDRVPEVVFDDFRGLVTAEGFDLVFEPRPTSGPFAGLEWLIPPAVVLFIGRAYFETFLSEMAKDHYALLKQGINGLKGRFDKVKVTMVGTPGKVSAEQPYSLVYAIYLEGGPRRKLKFMPPSSDWEPAVSDQAMEAFFEFVEDFYLNALDPETAGELAATNAIGGTVLLAFNPVTGKIAPLNPMTKQFPSIGLTGEVASPDGERNPNEQTEDRG
jgi:hypothetical protein